MARAIDADELEKKFGYGPNDTEEERAFNQAARKIIREMPTLIPPNEPMTPCDVCMYNPPSSMDGKPCCFCPANPPERQEDT